jgi:hypothetical protein
VTRNQLKTIAFHLSIALGSIDAAQQMEKRKSARWNRLDGLVDGINQLVELIKTDLASKQVFSGLVFTREELDNAAAMIDMVNERITELYPMEGK